MNVNYQSRPTPCLIPTMRPSAPSNRESPNLRTHPESRAKPRERMPPNGPLEIRVRYTSRPIRSSLQPTDLNQSAPQHGRLPLPRQLQTLPPHQNRAISYAPVWLNLAPRLREGGKVTGVNPDSAIARPRWVVTVELLHRYGCDADQEPWKSESSPRIDAALKGLLQVSGTGLWSVQGFRVRRNVDPRPT